jgi:hypothetical protein
MTKLISPEYCALNQALHADRPTYGAAGHRWAARAAFIALQYQAKDVLDYGCGKGALKPAFPQAWTETGGQGPAPGVYLYDPAVPAFAAEPLPHDVVVCADVLEHVEPDCLDAVLADLARVTLKICFAVIATRPAKKVLSDGRNAHLLVQPPEWWRARMNAHFAIVQWSWSGGKEEVEMELATLR